MSNISTLIEKRSCLEYLKKEKPELTPLFELIDEMVATIVDMHMHTGTVTFTADMNGPCPVPQSISNTNASATCSTYMPKDGRGQF